MPARAPAADTRVVLLLDLARVAAITPAGRSRCGAGRRQQGAMVNAWWEAGRTYGPGRGVPVLPVDEVQRFPGLLRAITVDVERGRRPGRFPFSGWADVSALPRYGVALAGRIAIARL